MMNISKRLDTNFRAGFRLNMPDLLQDLEDQYRASLKATVDNFDFYDEVSNETFNDASIMKAQLALLVKTGYLDQAECEAMIQVVDMIRMNILKDMKGEEKDGSKENNI